ncbi:hypothetical protein [Nonomuraea maritima]|uniref:hypothetical protein n=1 Tax=Nonomuraea maritima TaxID=683260 RepID=UPI0037219209
MACSGGRAEAGCTIEGNLSWRACGSEVVMRATVGCVHEHLEDVAVCQHHVEDLAVGEVFCTPCYGYGPGHSCSVSLLAEIDEAGERRVLRG